MEENNPRRTCAHFGGCATDAVVEGFGRTVVDALAAFGAGHRGLVVLVDGHQWTFGDAFVALLAFVVVESDLKDVDFVEQRQQRAHRTKRGALNPLFGENRQHDAERNEEGVEDDVFDERGGVHNLFALSNSLERAEPIAILRHKALGTPQSH